MAVTDKDMGFKDAMDGIKQLVGSGAKIGLMPPSSQEVIDRGVSNEFGTANAPARPFMRTAIDDHPDEVTTLLVGALIGAITGEGAGVTTVAVGIKDLVKGQIEDSPSWAEANAPSTIALKGFDHPLIETGEMLDSISFIVTSGDAL